MEKILICLFIVHLVHSQEKTSFQAQSASYQHVKLAYDSAKGLDTIFVPAGTAEWKSTLEIKRGIHLIGAGSDRTIITNATDSTEYKSYEKRYIISYIPEDYEANYPFQVQGFTFNLNNNGSGIGIGVSGKKAPFKVQTKILIIHNEFINSNSRDFQAIWDYGGCYGVVCKNKFLYIVKPIRSNPNVAGNSWWNNFSWKPGVEGGDSNCLYFEDNFFTGISGSALVSSQCSGRYIYRYNDIQIISDCYPLFDQHGNQQYGNNSGEDGGMYSCFGAELYGNTIHIGNNGICFFDQRGGKSLVFYNRIVGNNVLTKVREERNDSQEPAKNSLPQHVSESYYWNNRNNSKLFSPYVGDSVNYGGTIGIVPKSNRDFFYQVESFTGDSGCGCGPKSKMPSKGAPGTAYWETDQPCDENIPKPIIGTLWRADENGNWKVFYKPLRYPHPLRALNKIKNFGILQEKV